jgi:hypothetical protein
VVPLEKNSKGLFCNAITGSNAYYNKDIIDDFFNLQRNINYPVNKEFIPSLPIGTLIQLQIPPSGLSALILWAFPCQRPTIRRSKRGIITQRIRMSEAVEMLRTVTFVRNMPRTRNDKSLEYEEF